MTYHRTTALVVVGWLYVLTGVTMLIAPSADDRGRL